MSDENMVDIKKKNIYEALSIPSDMDKSMLREWCTATKIGGCIFTSKGETTQSFINRYSSRSGGPLKCVKIETTKSTTGYSFLYKPIDVLKLMKVKGVLWETTYSRIKKESRRLNSLKGEIRKLDQEIERKASELSLASLGAENLIKKSAIINTAHFPEGRPLNYNEILENSWQSPDVLSGVYFLIKSDEIVYVGMSADMTSRVSGHMKNPEKVFDRISLLPIPKHSMRAVESYYISLLNPSYNKQSGMSLERLVKGGL